MQIGSGQTPLSLMMLKTLGTQLTAPQAESRAGAGSPPAKPVPRVAAETAQAEPAGDLGVARTVPRGSFVDLKV